MRRRAENPEPETETTEEVEEVHMIEHTEPVRTKSVGVRRMCCGPDTDCVHG